MGKTPSYEDMGKDSSEEETAPQQDPPAGRSESPDEMSEELLPGQHIRQGRGGSKQRHSSGPALASSGPQTSAPVTERIRQSFNTSGIGRLGRSAKGYPTSGTLDETESLYDQTPDEDDEGQVPALHGPSGPPPPADPPRGRSVPLPSVRLRSGPYKPLSELEAAYPVPAVVRLEDGSGLTYSPSHALPSDVYQDTVESPRISRIAQRRLSEMSFESMDNGSAWQEEYRHRPSWCDARAALQQVKRGQAEGFKPALWVRGEMQRVLFALGVFIQRHKLPVLLVMALVLGAFGVGLVNVSIQTDIVKLWVPKGGRLERELNFLSKIQAESAAAKGAVHDHPPGDPASQPLARKKRQVDEAASELLRSLNLTATNTTTTSTTTTTTETPRRAVVAEVVKKATEAPTEEPKPVSNAESGSGGGFQVVIQTPRHEAQTVLTPTDLLLHAKVLQQVAEMKVEMYGESWQLSDICFKPPAPQVELGPLTGVVQNLLDKIIPCIFISPLDCFWDGAKPLGPFPAIAVPEFAQMLVPSLPSGAVSWKNLNPHSVIRDIDEYFDLGDVATLFDRAGIKAAYQDRPCLDPLDPECPRRAPNSVDHCAMVAKFVEWNAKVDGKDAPPRYALAKAQAPVEEAANQTAEEADDYEDYSYDDYSGDDGVGGAADGFASLLGTATAAAPQLAKGVCRDYSASVRALLSGPRGAEIAREALEGTDLLPVPPDLGSVMSGGCNGFASSILNWPEEMIIGGLRHGKNANGSQRIDHAEAYQSVMMVASNEDLFSRFRNRSTAGSKGSVEGWSLTKAEAIINAWQRNFTALLYNHANNSVDEEAGTLRQIHPLAATSVGDMLTEFSKFKPTVIFIGYFLMLIYAGACLGSWRERGVQSCAGLGVAGVLLVTFASLAGLGASTILGIEFNAATTQIVPFLTLGLGVDDMFLLVHSYQDTIRGVAHNEIGHLLKETGLSVLLTSVNNILAFSVGGFLPVPALRSFCFQTAILLFFNMICIISLFPAVIALDLERRKDKRVDILCCLSMKDRVLPSGEEERPPPYEQVFRSNLSKAKSASNATSVASGAQTKPSRLSSALANCSLEHFVSHVYGPFLERWPVKAAVMVFFGVLLALGGVGAAKTTLGLELTDVIPKGTAPYDFLTARQRYFSFYPIYGVLKGPLDFPNQQLTIHRYQAAISNVSYIVKNQVGTVKPWQKPVYIGDHWKYQAKLDQQFGKTGDMYWLEMMTKWVTLLQQRYDEDAKAGIVNGTAIDEGRASAEAKLAYRLICQRGGEVDCERNGNVRLLEELTDPLTGKPVSLIRRDSFYNLLSAWVKLDNMMYYVTQAAFFPAPPADWEVVEGNYSLLIPPAEPPLYSQIPFFVNGLTDTEETVVALREIRALCEAFEEAGLPNFPQGIPFTFWEQYLHLMANLLFCVGLITATVFVVITVLLMSPWSAAMIVLVLVCCMVELCGFMGLVGIKMNPVSAVSLVTAVGIGVEFTVHIALSFLTNMGSRNERMQATLDHMFTPVLHGGISTLLGIIMLAFSEFEFIVLYFFVVMSGLIVIGLLNGLIFLPVLLSLVGPRSEVRAMDGSDAVPPPSPTTVKRQVAETGIGHHGVFHHSQPHGATELNHLSQAPARRHSAGAAQRTSANGPTRHESLSPIEEERDQTNRHPRL